MISSLIRQIPPFLHNRLRHRSFEYLRHRAYADWLATVNNEREPLIVYQMGKVGSSTVTRTLAQFVESYQVFQVHVLTQEWISKVEDQYRQASRDRGKPKLDQHILASRYLRARLDQESGRKWKVISLVRDPIARNVSAFFQAFPIYFSGQSAEQGKAGIAGVATEELVDMFLNEFGNERHNVPLEWFPMHFQPAFDLDIFATGFNKEQGYQIYQGERCELLLLRMENLKSSLTDALEEFLGCRIDHLADANAAADKAYADTYVDFHDQLKLPQGYVERMYNSDFARYFYTADELQAFRQRWQLQN